MTRRIPKLDWIKLVLADKEDDRKGEAPIARPLLRLISNDDPLIDDSPPPFIGGKAPSDRIDAWPMPAPYVVFIDLSAPQTLPSQL